MKHFIHIVKKNSSALKLKLPKLVKLTQLAPSTLNKTLFNIFLEFKIGKNFNLGPLTNHLEFDLLLEVSIGRPTGHYKGAPHGESFTFY